MANPAPAVVTTTVNPAQAWSVDYRIKNGGDSSNANLNGASVELQVWNPARTTQYASADVSWLDQAVGLVRVTVPQAAIFAMPLETELRADLALVDSLGNRRYLIRYSLTLPAAADVISGGSPSSPAPDLISGGSQAGEVTTLLHGGRA